jgi:UBA/TS-N domain
MYLSCCYGHLLASLLEWGRVDECGNGGRNGFISFHILMNQGTDLLYWHFLLTDQDSDLEVKIKRLMELGFDRESVKYALELFKGNEEQAAAFLFGWF